MAHSVRGGAGALALCLCHVAGPALGSEPYPYEVETGRELALVGVGAGLLGGAYVLDQGREPLTGDQIDRLDQNAVPGIDQGATRRWSPVAARASDVLLVATSLSPAAILPTDQGRREPWTLGVMWAESLLLTNGVMAILKSGVGRTRPFVYNPDPRIPLEAKQASDARRSFPSGHAANAFAGAVFLSTTHQRLYPGSDANPWIWGVSLAAATTTGVLRYVAGKHFPTDILAGAVLGGFVGWLVPELHEVEPAEGQPVTPMAVVFVRF